MFSKYNRISKIVLIAKKSEKESTDFVGPQPITQEGAAPELRE